MAFHLVLQFPKSSLRMKSPTIDFLLSLTATQILPKARTCDCTWQLPENRLPKVGSYVKFGNTSYWDEIFCKLPGATGVVQVKLCMDKKSIKESCLMIWHEAYLRKVLTNKIIVSSPDL